MSIIVYQDVATPIVPIDGLVGRIREALGDSLRSMRYPTPDFAGIYQDDRGMLPLTAVGQPVGLMLDRKFGLARGSEIIPTTGYWYGAGASSNIVTSIANNSFRMVAPNSGFARLNLPEPIKAGSFYEVDLAVSSASGMGLRLDNLPGGDYLANGRRTVRARAVAATYISLYGHTNTNSTATVHSFREIPGNHATQPTTTARPALRSGPLRIDYDGVDDYLRTVFPELGSNVTIARSIPGVGAQIITGQTIAAGNWDDNVTSCATLVIDRALTGPETALVTAFLNQQAGV